jgi:hypothetical protein
VTSTVIDVLSTPGVNARVITFDEQRPIEAQIADIAGAFATVVSNGHAPAMAAHDALASWSARTLAGQLAGVLDTVATQR